MDTLSYDLFEPNPNQHTDFPFVCLNVDDANCYPKRLHFQKMHWHNDIQITYVISGEVNIYTLNHTYTIRSGQAIFINDNRLHQIKQNGDVHYKSFLFPSSMISFLDDSIMHDTISKLSNNELDAFCLFNKEILNEIIILNTILQEGNLYYQYGVCAQLTKIIYLLLQVLPNDLGKTNIRNIKIENCIAYIHKNYAQEISLVDISQSGHLSSSQCGKIFKKVLNTSPYDYLINYRINKSIELLGNKRVCQESCVTSNL